MNNRIKFVVLLLIPILCNCYAEFDLGVKSARKDPCTGVVETKHVHIHPSCPNLPPPPPPENIQTR